MNEILVGLVVALGLALLAVLYFAVVLPGRVARLVLAEYARADTRTIAARAALHAASSAEVAVIVAPLRGLLEEQTRQVLAAREHTTAAAAGEVERITRGLRGLAEWLAAFANAQHAQAVAAQVVTAPLPAPEMTRKPEPAQAARARPSPQAPAIEPPGSATILPPEPAQLAAGLMRPSARAQGATRTPEPAKAADSRPRGVTMIGGLAAPSGPRGAQTSAPTLVSMAAVATPAARQVPVVAIQGEVGERHNERASPATLCAPGPRR